MLDCDQIQLAAVLIPILHSNLAPLPALCGYNPAPLKVVSGFNLAPLLLAFKSGFTPALLPAVCGHNQAPLPVILAKEAQVFQFFRFVDQILS